MNTADRFVVCSLVLLALAIQSHAQSIYFHAPHAGPPIAVDITSPGPYAQHKNPTSVAKGGATTFNISYTDLTMATGFGFDDPAEGATRRATAEAVLAYIGGILNEPAPVTLDLVFQESLNSGTGSLATGGTFFTGNVGFENGFAFEHITTGIDPAPAAADLSSRVDFAFNWHSDHTTSPEPTEFDLFSVLLHEMTHGFGLLSLSDAAGDSLIGGNPGNYTVWDQRMRFDSDTLVWNATTTALEVPASVFVSENLAFAGVNATLVFGSPPPITAPPTFQLGSSLGHFQSPAVTTIMTTSLAAGVERRAYSTLDVAALIDLGYTNASATPFSPATLHRQGGGGFVEEGNPVKLLIVLSNVVGLANTDWLHNGAAIVPNANIATTFSQTGDRLTARLTITAVDGSHAGSYTLTGDDAAKGIFQGGALAIKVVPPDTLPAVGAVGLGILAGAIVAIGALLFLRRRP